MKSSSLFPRFATFVLCFVSLFGAAVAQKPGSNIPRQEKLLNGLKLLMWSDPAATDVKVSIRIHSGSSFDPQGKEGVMQLLADNIFPTPASRSYFSEDLGGNLELITNYDYIQINASSKSSEFVTLLETLAQAVSNPTIDKETTASLKKSLTEKLIELQKDPAYVADQAAAKRLFGTFPYGRPQMGSVESLQRIDFADLLFARERFLSADNATVAISGNFNSDLGFRAARRYLGAWLKSDKRVPSTFRQPDDPDTKPLEITLDGVSKVEVRTARRALARNDKDYYASLMLSHALRTHYEGGLAKNAIENVKVSYEQRVLPGAIFVTLRSSRLDAIKQGSGTSLVNLTDPELAKLKSQIETTINSRSLAERWLDVDTYGLISVAEDTKRLRETSAADVFRVAERLAKNPEVVVIVKGS